MERLVGGAQAGNTWKLLYSPESKAQVLGIALKSFQKHKILIKRLIDGAQIWQHVEIIVVTSEKRKEKVSELRSYGDPFIKSFAKNSAKKLEENNVGIMAVGCPRGRVWIKAMVDI